MWTCFDFRDNFVTIGKLTAIITFHNVNYSANFENVSFPAIPSGVR